MVQASERGRVGQLRDATRYPASPRAREERGGVRARSNARIALEDRTSSTLRSPLVIGAPIRPILVVSDDPKLDHAMDAVPRPPVPAGRARPRPRVPLALAATLLVPAMACLLLLLLR